MPNSDRGTAGSTTPVAYSEAYKRTVALLLMLAYTLNSTDRSIIAIIGQSMKIDLRLSDTQLGLLAGTAFATLYAFSGIPIARLAERFNRVTIISIALVVWSALTALLGAAAGFTQLLLIRVGVGVGEAGCTPPAHSLISDYFAPQRRATALSVYSCGISVGYILGAILGGYVTLHYGWRAACVVVGLPGIGVALLLRRFVREPPRGYSEPPAIRSAAPLPPTAAQHRSPRQPFSLLAEAGEVVAVARMLLLTWPVANIVIGVTIATFVAQGSYAFVPAFFNRAFGLDYGTIGLVAALTGGVAVGFGLLAGGFLADLLGARGMKWYALVPAIGLAISMPLYMLAFVQSDWQTTAVLLGVAGFFQYVSFGPTFGIVQNVVDTRRRATATALIYVLLNLIGLGCGPLFTGWSIDRFAEFDFARPAADSVGKSFAAMTAADGGTGASFHASCPGGRAPATADRAGQSACASTLALASRQGILVTLLLYGWAALHYLLAAFGLEREMQRATLRNAAAAAH
jgi:predicted MFS family arabinose efflux permease